MVMELGLFGYSYLTEYNNNFNKHLHNASYVPGTASKVAKYFRYTNSFNPPSSIRR